MFDIDDSFWAHTKDQKEPETLITHTNLTKNYLENIKTAKNLTPLIDNLTTEILEKTNSLEFKNLLLEIFNNLIIWHDIGKTNPAFQAIKMKNKAYKKGFDSSTHSDKSFQKIKEFYKNRVLETKNSTIIYLFYHLLSNVLNHHGELKDGLNYSELDETGLDADFRNINKKGLDDYRVYVFIKLHFSLLIASDFYATSEYMNDIKTICFGTFDKVLKDEIYLKFHNFYESLNKTKPIDKFRTKIFNETAKNLNKNLDKNLFYLEAPTGSGKTLTSLNLALNLLKSDEKLNKIFYIFPFNTLITQTESLISKIFENHLDFAVINSITAPKFSDQENEETKYDKTYINRMFFNHHLILTSHVNLFDILFGVLKESNYPLFSLANSVIIIDEIQSYDPNLWEYMAYFFDKFAKLLNIKFIIMSATLPKISKLLKSDDDWCDLLPNSDEIFQNPLFKERVKVDYSLLKTPKEVIFDEMIKVAKSSKKEKILFEFITKNSAREFYNYIKDKFDEYEIYELSGDDNKLYRDLIINKSKSSIKLIIVATQVIEAGVDIDMDLGFKDISILESEEQFLGRVNRNSMKSEAVVYFFDYFDSNKIYKDDRTKFSLKDKKWQDALKSKNFSPYYEALLNELRVKNSSAKNALISQRDEFLTNIYALKFKLISQKMVLINDNKARVFLPFSIDVSGFDLSEYPGIEEFMDGSILDGKKVWDAILDINSTKNYSKRKIKALSLNALADIFSFQVYAKNLFYSKNLPVPYKFGYYYIEECENLVDENGKFLRENFAAKFNNESLFL